MGRKSMSPGEHARRRRWYRFFRAITILMFLGAGLLVGIVAGLFASVAEVLPKGDALEQIRPSTPTRVLASDGSLLARVYLPDQNREIVPLNRMGPWIANATIAIEDERFRSHPGVDLWGIMRALRKNIISGDSKEGASTITQQLARNLYLTRKKKLTRKLQEVILALQIERRYSKDEILETYLNQVFYGSNRNSLQSWGVQIAARNYFNKSVEQLTLAEAALLAGLPKNPKGNDPYRNKAAALQRRKLVLRSMLANYYISREQYEKAVKEPLKLATEKPLLKLADYHAPYFVRHILTTEMQKIFGEDASDYIYRYGVDIYTSLDARMQKVAEETVIEQVRKNKFRRIDDGCLVAVDPQTGFVKALVGGTDYNKDQFDIATQGHRQPGSSFKPFVYTTALLHGYTPRTIVQDKPHRFPSGSGQIWSPKNSDGGFRGPMPLQQALWLSRNAAAAGVAYDVGIEEIIKVAHRMGIKYRLDPNLATSLGASVVVPLEICSGYGTLANHGVYNPPTSVVRVMTGTGDVLYEYRSRPQRAIPTKVADTMKEMMRGVIERGTGRAARCPFPASGKTGTTNSYRDAWFIGYTDNLAAAVWVGNRSNQPMNRTFGGTVPAPIWRQFMLVAEPIMAAEHKEAQAELQRANNLPDAVDLDTTPTEEVVKQQGRRRHRDTDESATTTETPVVQMPQPGDEYTIAICQETGDRSTRWCPDKVMVTYVKGREPEPPSATCARHTGVQSVPSADGSEYHQGDNAGVPLSICAETRKLATDKCPTVLLRRYTRNAPTETCPLHGGE